MKFIDAVNELRAGKVKEFERKGGIIIFWKEDNFLSQIQFRNDNGSECSNPFVSEVDLDADWQPVKEEKLEENLSDFVLTADRYIEKALVVSTYRINWAVKKLKESIKEGVNRNDILPLDWCFDRIDKIFGPKLLGEVK
jgi:hypothetical protein